jgi:hypothetical protein
MRRKATAHSRPVTDGRVECRHDATTGWRTVRAITRRRSKTDDVRIRQDGRSEVPEGTLRRLWQYILKLTGKTGRR